MQRYYKNRMLYQKLYRKYRLYNLRLYITRMHFWTRRKKKITEKKIIQDYVRMIQWKTGRLENTYYRIDISIFNTYTRIGYEWKFSKCICVCVERLLIFYDRTSNDNCTYQYPLPIQKWLINFPHGRSILPFWFDFWIFTRQHQTSNCFNYRKLIDREFMRN